MPTHTSTERAFYFFDCEIVSGKSGAAIPSMRSLVDIWQAAHTANKGKIAVRNETASLLLGDIERNDHENYFTALVRLSDTLSPNSVYSDVDANSFTEHVKTGRQGNDVAAHILVSLAPERNIPNTYFAIVEAVPGLSYSEIRRLLNRLLRMEYHATPGSFVYPDPHGKLKRDGTPLVHRHLPRLDFGGRASANFVRDIERGKLTGISLIKKETHTPVAGVPYLTKAETALRLNIDSGNVAQNMWDDLKRAFLVESVNFPQAEVRFRLPDQARSVSVRVDSRTGAPLSETYIQSVLLRRISPLLSSSSRSIVRHLVDLAKVHLLGNRSI